MRFALWEKICFALLITAWAVFGANQLGNVLVHAETLDKPAYTVVAAEAKPAAAKQEAAAASEDALALLASADPKRGAKVFNKCKACHTVDKVGKNKVGPNLWNVVDRQQGGAPGFKFSAAITGLGGTWTYAELDKFLANPKGCAKGNKMTFAGVKKASDRAAVILYLRDNHDNPPPLP